MGPRYVIRDDCDQMGRTYVARWRVNSASFSRTSSAIHGVDVDWTVVRADAVVFDDREIARLIAHLAGGRAVRLKSKPPKRVWIEFSSDGQEVLATHGSEDEARAGRLRGAVIAGPYVLEGA